jgi:hypothetical protein
VGVVAAHADQRLPRAVLQQRQVGQAGEAVMEGHDLDALLRRLAIGDFHGETLVGLAHAGYEDEAIDQAVGDHLVQVAEQAVELVDVAVGGEAQLGEDGDQRGGEQAAGIV